MSKLPTGWAQTTLEKVADWGSGGTPSRSHTDYYGGSIPWIKTGELGQGLITDTEEKITQAALDNSSAKIFPNGSVALAMYGATIGKVAILGVDAATNQACAVGIPRSYVTTSKYLLHYLTSQKQEFVAKGQGGAQPNISQGIVKSWPIPLAPLHEQDRAGSGFSDRPISGMAAIFFHNSRSISDETTETQPLADLQGEGGFGSPKRREDDRAAGSAL